MRLFFPLSGDDVFISYSRRDGALYAAGLADELTKKTLSCFIDKLGTEPNHDLPPSLTKKIKSCSVFVLIGTEKAAQSEFVQKEIAEFKQTGRTILPIDFEGNVGKAIWYEEIPGLAVETEKDLEALETGNPSQNVTSFIEKSFNYTRRNQYMFRMFCGAVILFFLLTGLGIGSYLFAKQEADRQTKRAEEQTEKANEAERRANEQTLLANAATKKAAEQTEKADEAEKRATEQEEIAKNKEAIAIAATEKADKAAKVAEEKTKIADLATKRAEEQTQKAELAENKAVEAQNRADIAAEQEQGSRVMDIARQPGREFDAVKMIHTVAKSNFNRPSRDAQVINGLVTSVIAADYALPVNIERDNISFVQLSPDGSLLFVESENPDESRKWEFFSLPQAALLFEADKPNEKATGVSFSRNNARVAVSTVLGITIWDVSSKSELTRRGGGGQLPVVALDSSGERVAYAESGNKLLVENLNTRETKVYSFNEERFVENAAFYPNGDLLINIFTFQPGGSHQNELMFCSQLNNTCTRKGLFNTGVQELVDRRRDGSGTGSIYTGTQEFAGIRDDGAVIITSFVRNTNGTMAGSGATIYQFNDNGERVERHLTGYKGQVWSLSLTQPQRIVTSQEDALRIADVQSSPNFYALRGHDQDISGVVFSSDGKYIATSSYKTLRNNRVNVWNAKTGELLHDLETLKNPRVFAFSKDNTKLAAFGGGTDRIIEIWNLSTGEYISPSCGISNFKELKNAVAVSFLRDDKFIATIDDEGEDVLMPERISGGRLIIWNAENCTPVKAMTLPFSVYDIQQFQLGTSVNTAMFSPDGETLITEEIAKRMYQDYVVTSIKKWDLSGIDLTVQNADSVYNPVPLTSTLLFPADKQPPGRLKAVNFNGELRLLFETQNNEIQITRSDGSPPITLQEGFERITEANFSRDGQLIVAADEVKQEVKIWNAATGQTILAVNIPFFSISKAFISPDGKTFAITSRDGAVRIYPTTPEGFLEIASNYVEKLSN